MPNGESIALIEVVNTEVSRSEGLSGREQMADHEGMWFVFDQEGIYPFWMKDMKFSIDIVWVDDDYRVTDIYRNAPLPVGDSLPVYSNSQPARYVLEVNAGLADVNQLKIGDKLIWRQE